MVSYKIMKISVKGGGNVLILVVVEDGLVPDAVSPRRRKWFVLILVVVEDGLVRIINRV